MAALHGYNQQYRTMTLVVDTLGPLFITGWSTALQLIIYDLLRL